MRLPRIRFTVRRLMVAVGVLAILLGIAVQARRALLNYEIYKEKAYDYDTEEGSMRYIYMVHCQDSPEEVKERLRRLIQYYGAMKAKYEAAMRHPWIDVEPDPPVPE